MVGYPIGPARVTLSVTGRPRLNTSGHRDTVRCMTCNRCGRDKGKAAFCCDQRPSGDRKRDDVAYEKALSSLLEKGWAKIIEVEGELHITLTERGYFVITTEEAAAAAWS